MSLRDLAQRFIDRNEPPEFPGTICADGFVTQASGPGAGSHHGGYANREQREAALARMSSTERAKFEAWDDWLERFHRRNQHRWR